jgi:hypothetical protein
MFSTVEKHFSIVWKIRENFFHCVEKQGRIFHSMETFFHSVEKPKDKAK